MSGKAIQSASSASPWAPYEPTDPAPWNVRRVVHLHRRAGFAASWSEVQRDLTDGPRVAIDRLLAGATRERGMPADFENMAGTIGEAATASSNPNRLKAWWLYRVLMSPDPLGERLALMWHNHFATSNRKVQDLVQMRSQNDLFRACGRAPFGELLAAVVKHPAMLVWLDADSNRKGHPNENLARELMELFTLGIGNYTEADVQEAARALTGWTVVNGEFQFRDARHDGGEKTVLGHHGPLHGDDLLQLLLEHPAMSRRLAWRICRTLMAEGVVDDEAIDQLAAGLQERQLDVAWALDTVLRSELFFSTANIGSRVVGPVEYVVGALQALELCQPPPSTLLLAEWTARMGQDLFYPPNVGGWNEGRAWLGSRAIVARANFATALIEGRLWHPARTPDLWELVKRHRTTDDLEQAVAWFGELMCGHVSPDVVSEVVAATSNVEGEKQLPAAVALLMSRPEGQLV